MYSTLRKLAHPYLVKGHTVSPVEHIDYVRWFVVRLAEAAGVCEGDRKILQLAAILHDIGICECKLPKVVESDVIRDISLMQAAIDCRLEHMYHGGRIAIFLLAQLTKMGFTITRQEHVEIIRLVKNHDNYKITRYGHRAMVYTDELMRLLNEADVLWMFTRAGIETDIRRGSGFTVKEQVNHNLRTAKEKIKSNKGVEILQALLREIDEQD